ncbi:Xanthine phosphoribosyltransferase 1 [Vanrija albida]|uniref:Xanthine phosphoribosyltransferase 1 n=1 Tax=Vanrija albida TaxID=181172 RepID=A0ABR3PX49_9TREE
MPRKVRHYLTPRVLTPILLWTSALWLIHRFLFAIPLPSLTTILPGLPGKAAHHHLSDKFPPPPPREGEDWRDSVDPRYRPLAPLTQPSAPFPRLRPTRFLPQRCLEAWFADGRSVCDADELGPEETLDAAWLWVNGSDRRWREEMVYWRQHEGIYSPEHHFREQNELVYSMRSVMAALGGHIKTIHLIVYDYAFNVTRDLSLLPEATIELLEKKVNRRGSAAAQSTTGSDGRRVSAALAQHLESRWRVAQTPTWLDFSRLDPSSPTHPFSPANGPHVDDGQSPSNGTKSPTPLQPMFRYATHSEIFHLPTIERDAMTMEPGEKEWREKQWRKNALPTYNSMSIESRVGWLPGLADVALALNDDFFILRPHAVADFHSPFYGNVIRFDMGFNQQIKPMLDKTRFNDAGEMGGLYHANYLLSQRFPRRRRPYFAHSPKVITRGLHHESSLMFKEALTVSSSRRFREMNVGHGDIQMQWLLSQLRVERWREALLWTYLVANLGGADGRLGDSARDAFNDLFGLKPVVDDDVVQIEVYRGPRWTLERARMNSNFDRAGWEAPKATEFLWSSLDGHLPQILPPSADAKQRDQCLFDLERCFGGFWTRKANVSASDMFKRLTFQAGECGDCLIMALVTASGPLGLSPFFPLPNATYTNLAKEPFPEYLPPPHLPLTPTWQEADFSIQNVMSTTSLPGEVVNLRTYTMHLLSRYLYISGKSVSHFHMLKDPAHARKVVKMIEDNPKVSIMGMNDDIIKGYDEVRATINDWFNKRWPAPAVWERAWRGQA